MTETRRTYCGLCHPRCGARLRMAAVDPRMADVQYGWWFPDLVKILRCPAFSSPREYAVSRCSGVLQPGNRQLAAHRAPVPSAKGESITRWVSASSRVMAEYAGTTHRYEHR